MKIINRNEKGLEELTKKLYLEDEYLKKIPNLHEFDSSWKLTKIIPFIDKFMTNYKKYKITILDIGGGAGVILKGVSSYLEKCYSIFVNSYALDLSPKILEIQKKRNPDLIRALNEDICNTSLSNKEIDLTLMIDVLEHIPHPEIALKELRRISNFVILKVPLEDNLYYRIWNFLKRGEKRQYSIENSGHINFYNFTQLKHQIETYLGIILDYKFTNVFEFLSKTNFYRRNMNFKDKLLNSLSLNLFRISPKLVSLLFHDFVMVLCECY